MNRVCLWMALAVALVAAACTEPIDPAEVTATTISFGRYDVQSGTPAIVSATNQISCEPGVVFGVDYRVDVGEGRRGVIPVEFRWRHPELSVPSKKLWGTETAARLPNPPLPPGESSISGRALWELADPEERISGQYEFIIRVTTDGRIILRQAFEIEGC